MDRAEILNTARQADIEVAHMSNGKIRTDDEIREQWVVCFATMIEASVKEKASKIAEMLVTKQHKHINYGKPFQDHMHWEDIAAAIRSMK